MVCFQMFWRAFVASVFFLWLKSAAAVSQDQLVSLIKSENYAAIEEMIIAPVSDDTILAVRIQNPYLNIFPVVHSKNQHFYYLASKEKLLNKEDNNNGVMGTCGFCQEDYDYGQVLTAFHPLNDDEMYLTAKTISKIHCGHTHCLNGMKTLCMCIFCKLPSSFRVTESMMYFNIHSFKAIAGNPFMPYLEDTEVVKDNLNFTFQFLDHFFGKIGENERNCTLSFEEFFNTLCSIGKFYDKHTDCEKLGLLPFTYSYILQKFHADMQSEKLQEFCEYMLKEQKDFVNQLINSYVNYSHVNFRNEYMRFVQFILAKPLLLNLLSPYSIFSIKVACEDQNLQNQSNNDLTNLYALVDSASEISHNLPVETIKFFLLFLELLLLKDPKSNVALENKNFSWDHITNEQFEFVLNKFKGKEQAFESNAAFLISKINDSKLQIKIIAHLFDSFLTPAKTTELLQSSEGTFQLSHEWIIQCIQKQSIIEVLSRLLEKVDFDQHIKYFIFTAACKNNNPQLAEFLLNFAIKQSEKFLLQLYLCDILEYGLYSLLQNNLNLLNMNVLHPSTLINSKGFESAPLNLKHAIIQSFEKSKARSVSVFLFLQSLSEKVVNANYENKRNRLCVFFQIYDQLKEFLVEEDKCFTKYHYN